jgi:hypothetical protein
LNNIKARLKERSGIESNQEMRHSRLNNITSSREKMRKIDHLVSFAQEDDMHVPDEPISKLILKTYILEYFSKL